MYYSSYRISSETSTRPFSCFRLGKFIFFILLIVLAKTTLAFDCIGNVSEVLGDSTLCNGHYAYKVSENTDYWICSDTSQNDSLILTAYTANLQVLSDLPGSGSCYSDLSSNWNTHSSIQLLSLNTTFTLYSCLYETANSERLTKTPGSVGNRKKWTWSAWVKRVDTGSQDILFSAVTNGPQYSLIRFNANNTLEYARVVSSAIDAQKISSSTYTNTSDFLHIVVVEDAENSVARIYVNNSEVSYGTNNNPSNVNGAVNNTVLHANGFLEGVTVGYFGAYVSEEILIDGQALVPGNFAENVSGVWLPKDVSGLAFGTNGFYRKFSDGSDLGKDFSGNGNDWATTSLDVNNQSTVTPANN